MTLLDYTIGNDTFEYPVSDEQLRQFFKSELSSYDIVDEYLDKNDLDYDDVILKDEQDKIIEPTTLIQYCNVISSDENILVIR